MKTLFTTLLIIVTSFQISFAQQHFTKGSPLPCLEKKFTVVAHIVRDTFGELNITEADILLAIDSLNFYFEPICASFQICEFRIIDNYQYDNPKNGNEFQQMQVKFHQKNRINMFFVNNVSWSVDPCGFATNSGIEMLEEGGILVNKSCLTPDLPAPKGLPHLVGHYFGLFDTNRGQGNELVDGSNCLTAGDEICDTPSDPYVNGQDFYLPFGPPYLNGADGGCRFVYTQGLDANGEYYRTHTSNIMSQYPEYCKCGFTHEQFVKMANTYLNAEDKMW